MYAIVADASGNMIGNAELIGRHYVGQVDGLRLEAWRGSLLTVARELSKHAARVILVSEPIWRFGTVIA